MKVIKKYVLMVIDIRARREILKSRWLARVVSGNLITYTKSFLPSHKC